MQNKSCAFTLIELLVVVLIIGILAAIAVPQYQMAVDKARVKAIFPVLRHIKDAEEVYKLANGNYTLNFEELGVDLPIQKISQDKQHISLADGTGYTLSSSGTYWSVTGDSKAVVSIYLSLENWTWLCYTRGKERGRKICKSLGCADASGDSCSFKVK